MPLVVDLDGTLLHSDLLFETGMSFIRKEPQKIYKILGWVSKGKIALKQGLANTTQINIAALPYNDEVIRIIKREKDKGRTIVLATASYESLANQVAEHLQLFDRVLATTSESNLSAENKRDLLVEHYGKGGFDYIGNAKDDLPVWAAAREAIAVDPTPKVERAAKKQNNLKSVIHSDPSGLKDWIRAIRLHQWMKNILIFVPLLAAHQLSDPTQIYLGILAFLFFGLCASSVYILNDLLDLSDDRQHTTKKYRPFASGKLSIKSGLIAFPILLMIAFVGAWYLLPIRFSMVLIAYYVLTLFYSLLLKRQMVIDVITLAMLYTLRIIAGVAAFSLTLTFWILAFSMFMFLSLALVKRYTELYEAKQSGQTKKTTGRGYFPNDIEMISSFGATSGYLAVMVLALYVHDQATVSLYQKPYIMWMACPLLLFWITRVWMIAHRGEMHDDPVVFAARDRTSLVVGILFCLMFWAAS